jgi:hypothetical protein
MSHKRLSGLDVWWVRHADTHGRIRREHAGTKSGAIKLYHVRKMAALVGKKLRLRVAEGSVHRAREQWHANSRNSWPHRYQGGLRFSQVYFSSLHGRPLGGPQQSTQTIQRPTRNIGAPNNRQPNNSTMLLGTRNSRRLQLRTLEVR